MFFSLSVIAAFASLTQGAVIEQRATSLCNQPNYGAQGYPWQQSSQPGSFCGSHKPSNNGQWGQIPYWDGGDTVKCKNARNGLKVCNGGNTRSPLPAKCHPPHSGGKSHSKHSKSTQHMSSTTSVKPVTTSQTTSVKPVTTSTSPVPTTTNKSVVPSSATGTTTGTGTTTTGSSTTGTGTTSPGTTSTGTSTTPVTTQTTTTTGTSTSPAAPTHSSDPYSDPVCDGTFQVMASNYTIIAPNGYWMGQRVGAAIQDGSYMTYTLATSVDDCLAACNQIEGCAFVNTYYDTNPTETDLPKHAPGVLTCAMFSTCPGLDTANNFGGQDDPNVIVDSNMYCRSGACGGN